MCRGTHRFLVWFGERLKLALNVNYLISKVFLLGKLSFFGVNASSVPLPCLLSRVHTDWGYTVLSVRLGPSGSVSMFHRPGGLKQHISRGLEAGGLKSRSGRLGSLGAAGRTCSLLPSGGCGNAQRSLARDSVHPPPLPPPSCGVLPVCVSLLLLLYGHQSLD